MAHAETVITALVRQRLRGLRQAQGLSLDELGQRANLSPSTISRIETGRRNLSLETLVALAGALSASLDELMSPAADDDVVIRPTAREGPGVVTWWLNRPTYGLTTQIESSNPLDVQFSQLRLLWRDLKADGDCRTRLRRLWNRPGWQPHPSKELASHSAGSGAP